MLLRKEGVIPWSLKVILSDQLLKILVTKCKCKKRATHAIFSLSGFFLPDNNHFTVVVLNYISILSVVYAFLSEIYTDRLLAFFVAV